MIRIMTIGAETVNFVAFV